MTKPPTSQPPNVSTEPDRRPSDPSDELAAARETEPGGPGATDRPDDGMAPLINNTGDDGGAPTG
jgi:hypothetical protein